MFWSCSGTRKAQCFYCSLLAAAATTRVLYLLHLAHSRSHGHGGREQAGRVAFVVQVIDELSVFRFLCNRDEINETQILICLSNFTPDSLDWFFLKKKLCNLESSYPTQRHSLIRSPPRSWSCWRPCPGSDPPGLPPPHPPPGCSAAPATGASRARGGRSSLCCSYER